MLDEELLKIAVANCVNSGNNDVLNLSVLGELINSILVHKVHPVLPLVLLREVDVIVNKASIEAAWKNLLLQLDLH